ncbi:phenylalanyl-tRNA synthetase [Chytridium lagenaria]|nr:phenylalanyl-tRNA synthetase [Chytridium lagenaria]
MHSRMLNNVDSELNYLHWRCGELNVKILDRTFKRDEVTNITDSLLSKIPRRLHLLENHPLNILKRRIESYFQGTFPGYTVVDSLNPRHHPSRGPTDTYYVNAETVLRTHTSAHQMEVLSRFRRDEIDLSHYPVFHQMEGIRTFSRTNLNEEITKETSVRRGRLRIIDDHIAPVPSNPLQNVHTEKDAMAVVEHLKGSLEGLVIHLLGEDKGLEVRWIEGYFPFTSPSFELEVKYNDKWLELCGCGVIQQSILDASGNHDRIGWAFGLGLERIAMVLFDIPDIRLFWSEDKRFLSQFASGKVVKFQPYSKYPACYKDVSFWISEKFHDNDLFEVVRDVAGDAAEDVALIDTFTHPKTKKTSKCFRINYRSMDKTLTNEEVTRFRKE